MWGKQDAMLIGITKAWDGGVLQYTQVNYGVATAVLVASLTAAASTTRCG